MADADHIHRRLTIGQVADNAVIAHAISPSMRVTLQRLPFVAWITFGYRFEEIKDSTLYRTVEFGELLFGSRSKSNRPGQGAALPG